MSSVYSVVQQWDWLGPGVVAGIDLQAYVAGAASRRRLLLALVARAGERLRGFGSCIPLSYLNVHVNEKNRGFVKDQPVDPLMDLVRQLGELIEERHKGSLPRAQLS